MCHCYSFKYWTAETKWKSGVPSRWRAAIFVLLQRKPHTRLTHTSAVFQVCTVWPLKWVVVGRLRCFSVVKPKARVDKLSPFSRPSCRTCSHFSLSVWFWTVSLILPHLCVISFLFFLSFSVLLTSSLCTNSVTGVRLRVNTNKGTSGPWSMLMGWTFLKPNFSITRPKRHNLILILSCACCCK